VKFYESGVVKRVTQWEEHHFTSNKYV